MSKELMVDSIKIEVIHDWAWPISIIEVRSFVDWLVTTNALLRASLQL